MLHYHRKSCFFQNHCGQLKQEENHVNLVQYICTMCITKVQQVNI